MQNTFVDSNIFHRKGSIVCDNEYMTILYCGITGYEEDEIVFWITAKECIQNGYIDMGRVRLFQKGDRISYKGWCNDGIVEYKYPQRIRIDYVNDTNPLLTELNQILIQWKYTIYLKDGTKKEEELQISILAELTSDEKIRELINSF